MSTIIEDDDLFHTGYENDICKHIKLLQMKLRKIETLTRIFENYVDTKVKERSVKNSQQMNRLKEELRRLEEIYPECFLV